MQIVWVGISNAPNAVGEGGELYADRSPCPCQKHILARLKKAGICC